MSEIMDAIAAHVDPVVEALPHITGRLYPAIAKALRLYYVSLTDAGFKPEEALTLTMKMDAEKVAALYR